MDFIFDFMINVAAHSIGVRVLRFLTGGHFKGDSGYAWACAILVGGLVMVAPFAAFITWMIYTRGA